MKVILLQKKSFFPPAAKILKEAFFYSFKETKEATDYIRRKVKTKECLIAVEETEIVGVLMYHRDYSHDANYIEDIAVSRKHKRKGVASRLLKKFIEINKKETPKKQKYALSSTQVSNKISIRMHLKSGFKKIGTLRRLHYGEDEIFFARNLR